jgi:hypothetical protein
VVAIKEGGPRGKPINKREVGKPINILEEVIARK